MLKLKMKISEIDLILIATGTIILTASETWNVSQAVKGLVL